MSVIFLLLALAAFVAIGAGVGLVRSEPRPPIAGGDVPTRLRAWFATLAGRRLTGALLVAGGALAFVLVLAFRP